MDEVVGVATAEIVVAESISARVSSLIFEHLVVGQMYKDH